MSAVVEVREVVVMRGHRRVLDRVSLSVGPGETVVLLGPSGSGKTTLLRTVMGFVVPSSGAVVLRGEVASGPGRVRIRPEERNLAVVFQGLALWPHLTVAGNLAFGLRARGVPGAEAVRRIERVLAEVGLEGMGRRRPGDLSGGEQQRVAVARALVLEPDAVLLDEPLANLDIGLKADLLDLFERLFRAHHAAVLHVTHDPLEASRLAHRLIILDRGRVVFSGRPRDLAGAHRHPFVRQVAAVVSPEGGSPGPDGAADQGRVRGGNRSEL